MKTPYYETSPGALVALLASKKFVFCTLYTIYTANDGPVIRMCTADQDITVEANTFLHNAPPVDPIGSSATAHWKVGLDVDSWQLVVAPRLVDPVTNAANPDKIGNAGWIAAASAGALDGAQVQVDRAYFSSWLPWPQPQAPVGVVTGFYGRVANVDIGRTSVVITINSFLELLTMNAPYEVFQGTCRHTLFDAGCTLSAAAFKKTGTLVGVSAANVFTGTVATPSGSATYTLGQVQMTSGLNSGFRRSVRNWTSGSPSTFTLLSPFPFALAPGDTFDAYPGCDKSQAQCTAFSNLANYGGQPYVPDMMTAV